MNSETRSHLEQQNDILRTENTALRQIMSCPPCSSCHRPTVQPELIRMEQQLRDENEMIRRDIQRMHSFASQYFSWSQQVSDHNGSSSSSSIAVPLQMNRSPWFQVLAMARDSANEVIHMATIGDSMWNRNRDGGNETLNLDTYYTQYLPCNPRNINGFIHEASRATGLVAVNALTLVRNLANPSRLVEFFPSIIGNASLEARNKIFLVMKVEYLQIVSPLVSSRKVKFLRCFKQLDQNTWVMVDVSPDYRSFNPNVRSGFIRFPSGYLIQRLNNVYSKVTIIEHWGYKVDTIVNPFRSYLTNGLGFGAHRWLAALQRGGYCSSIFRELSPLAKRNLVNLSQKMVNTFCAGVCGITHQNWQQINTNRLLDNNITIFSRETQHQGSSCILLSATGLVRMQAKPDVIFGLLQGALSQDLWDHMRHNGEIEEVTRISRGPNPGNQLSVFRVRGNLGRANENYVLQETYHEPSASMVIHAAVNLAAAAATSTHGIEYPISELLPSGFTIMPGCQAMEEVVAGSSQNGKDECCIVTAGFQMIADGTTLGGRVSDEMVNAIVEMVSGTLEKVRNALPVTLGLH